MPCVIYNRPVTAVVGSGQEAADVIPSVVASQVVRKGQVFFGEEIPVLWKTAGTEELQQERRRFTIQGEFQGVVSLEPPVCTVAYNDAPLTFTDVSASISYSVYSFRGSYTKPEEWLPIKVAMEYSFDNHNWILYGTDSVSDVEDTFFIGVAKAEWDASENPYIYIRLRCSDGGEEIYSNVLRFAMDDLNQAEDQGGNRGGGTAIVNPPKEPVSVTETPASPEAGKNDGGSDVPRDGEADLVPKDIPEGFGQQGKKPVISSDALADTSHVQGNKADSAKAEEKPEDISRINADSTGKEETNKTAVPNQLADAAASVEKPDTVEKINADENRKDSGTVLTDGDSGEHRAGVPWLSVTAGLVAFAAVSILIFAGYRRMH